ncbi:MAG TPA: class I SAM-dependent methyltransferase [Paludibacter sp.]|nr:class I SAM-dependent methyltransferase [Paludibacter sp.]
MSRFKSIYKYVQHSFTARNTGGHGVHSPFMYQFTRYVLQENHPFYVFNSIENLRESLRKDKRVLNITDFGTGTNRSLRVSDIATRSLKPTKHSQLLFRIANYIKARNVLELGTSLGITTAYLGSVSPHVKCVTLEGCPEIASVASENFRKLRLENIELVVGNIDSTLPSALDRMPQLDMVFIDANHYSNAMLQYFELCLPKIHKSTIVIVDDIYWSSDMEKAWKTIKDHPQVTSSIDLFYMGIVFFNADLNKMHYKMRY